ncbi:MAG TPA: GntR family transcriptional regulator [Streptosporangiaceae bacterium]|jgi:GntR family transcriptional regulator
MGSENGDRSGSGDEQAARGPVSLSVADRQPKYLRIHGSLRDRITTGRWPAGTQLPAQRELADEFGVSIMTLRQALQLLADDGLVETRHGSGTFAAASYAYDLGHLRSFAGDLIAQGATITTRLLAAELVVPPADVAGRLGAPGEVLRLRRLRLSGGRPLILQASYLPPALASVLHSADLGRQGLYNLLAGHGLTIARAQETLSPTTLGSGDASDLVRPAGSPALLSHRISFTAAGVPLVDDHALLPADGVVLTVNRSAERLQAHYKLATPGSGRLS